MTNFKPVNFEFRRDRTFLKKLDVKILSGGVTSVYDLTGHTVKLALRNPITAALIGSEYTITDGVGYSDFDAGKLQLEIAHGDLATLPDEVEFELWSTSPGGRRSTLAGGRLSAIE